MFDPDPDLERTRRIDELCDEFERALQSGHHPQVEAFLSRATSAERGRLAVELLRVAIDYSGTRASDSAQCLRRKTVTEGNLQNGQASTLGEALEQSVVPTVELAKNSSAVGPSADGTEQPLLERVGDYQLLEVLGSGGMGTVYRARQLTIDRIVALKLIRPDRWPGLSVDQRQTAVDRFMRESQAAARREHPHVLTVYDAGHDGSTYFLAMRYVEGGSLADRVRQGPLPSDQVATYLEAVCRALHAVHQAHIIHRDLKPSNILVERETNTPLVGDFGLAKIVDSDQDLTLSGDFFGTPSYMSPEQVLHPGRVSVATDVYGVGATLYHLLTGRPPFQTPTVAATLQQILTHEPVAPRMLNPAIPLDLETITLKCLEKDHQRRYRNALEVAQELQRFLAGQPIVARPLRWDQKAWRWCTRHRTVSGLLASLAATLVLFASVVTWLYTSERAARTTAEQATRESQEQLAQFYLQRAELDNPLPRTASLPWLVEALRLERGNRQREFATRIRIGRTLATTPHLEQLIAHQAPISEALISPDGVLVGSGDAKGVVQVDRIGSPGTSLRAWQLDAAVTCMAFSPDSKRLAVGAADGSIHIYVVDQAAQESIIAKHQGPVTAVDFHPTDDRIVTAGSDGAAVIWDLRSGAQSFDPVQYPAPLYAARFSPSGDRVALACDDGRGYVLSANSETSSASTSEALGAMKLVAWHPKLPLLLTGGSRQGAVLHDLRDGGARQLLGSENDGTVAIDFSRDGSIGFAAQSDGKALFWPSGESGASARPIDSSHALETASLSPDGCWAAMGVNTPAVDLWQLGDRPHIGASLQMSQRVRSVQFDAASSRLLVAAGDTARIWHLIDADRKWHVEPTMSLESARCTQDGEYWAAIDGDVKLRLFRLSDDGLQPRSAVDLEYPIKQLALSGDAQRWAVADGRGLITFGGPGEASTGQIDARELVPLATLAIDPAGQQLAVIARSGKTWILSLDGDVTEKVEAELAAGTKWAVFDAQSRSLVAIGRDHRANLALIVAELRIEKVPHHAPAILMHLCGDGEAAVLGHADGTVTVVDIANGQSIASPIAIPNVPERFIATEKSELLAFVTGGTTQVCSVRRGGAASPAIVQNSPVLVGCFCHEGRLLATATEDGNVRVWDVATGKLVCRMPNSNSLPLACSYCAHRTSLRVLFADGSLCEHLLAPVPQSQEELLRESQRITGYQVDASGSLMLAR